MLAGCATKGDIRDLQSELRSLAFRQDSLLAELRGEMLSAQDTIRGQSAQLFDFRGELFRQLRELSDGISRLEALAGENQRGIVGIRDELANLRRSPAAAMDQPTGVLGEGEQAPGGGDAEGFFNAGVAQFNRGSLATARAAFESFLQAYPGHELAPDAHFFLADILVQEDRLEDALVAFQDIPQLFPTAGKVPDSLYRVALIQIELGQTDAARATLERVVNTYPGTGVAMLASEKLREIG
jgi:tol-pal system protein YbgF